MAHATLIPQNSFPLKSNKFFGNLLLPGRWHEAKPVHVVPHAKKRE